MRLCLAQSANDGLPVCPVVVEVAVVEKAAQLSIGAFAALQGVLCLRHGWISVCMSAVAKGRALNSERKLSIYFEEVKVPAARVTVDLSIGSTFHVLKSILGF